MHSLYIYVSWGPKFVLYENNTNMHISNEAYITDSWNNHLVEIYIEFCKLFEMCIFAMASRINSI